MYRRTRKLSTVEPVYQQQPVPQQQQQQQQVVTTQQHLASSSKATPTRHPATDVDEEAAANADLDAMLARYEKMAREPENQDEEQERRLEMKEERKAAERQMQSLKPRVRFVMIFGKKRTMFMLH